MKKIIFVIIGTFIGAGFASGQEIYQFFYVYGIKGIWGLAISSCLMSLVIYKILKVVYNSDISNYKDFLERNGKNKYLDIVSYVVNIFVLITFFIMIAGFGAYFKEQFGIPQIIGSIVLATICFFIFSKNIRGVVKVNEFIVPFIMGAIIVIGFGSSWSGLSKLQEKTGNFGWLMSSLLYAGYNSILLIPVLITLKDYLKNKEQISYIALISNIITIVLGIIIFLVLSNVGKEISQVEMPVVYAISKMANVLQVSYRVNYCYGDFNDLCFAWKQCTFQYKKQKNFGTILYVPGSSALF